MPKTERDRLLAQFQSAQREFAQWPAWMREAARIATPTLPVAGDAPAHSATNDPQTDLACSRQPK